MEKEYQQIIDFMFKSGKRIKARAGIIADIGITKTDLTEEDLKIERGFKEIINSFNGKHFLYAEEENADFKEHENVWVVDPISGTHTFIKGLPHYSIVVAHLLNGIVQFGAIYDPSVDEMFSAYRNKGAYLNDRKITICSDSNNKSSLLLNLSTEWTQEDNKKIWSELFDEFKTIKNGQSFGVNYAWVAAGRIDGIVAVCKDSFPAFAGSILIQEAGGILTNKDGNSEIKTSDRIFFGGTPEIYERLNIILNNK